MTPGQESAAVLLVHAGLALLAVVLLVHAYNSGALNGYPRPLL